MTEEERKEEEKKRGTRAMTLEKLNRELNALADKVEAVEKIKWKNEDAREMFEEKMAVIVAALALGKMTRLFGEYLGVDPEGARINFGEETTDG